MSAPLNAVLVFLLLLVFCVVRSIDYLDHVTTGSSNFGLYGITNDAIYSLDGNTRIVMQSDGNCVLSSRATASSQWQTNWQTNTYSQVNQNKPVLAVQRDGNLVLYASGSGNGWQS